MPELIEDMDEARGRARMNIILEMICSLLRLKKMATSSSMSLFCPGQQDSMGNFPLLFFDGMAQ